MPGLALEDGTSRAPCATWGSPGWTWCACRALQLAPAAVGEIGARVGERSAVLVTSKGLVPPLGTTPSAFVVERVRARAVASPGGTRPRARGDRAGRVGGPGHPQPGPAAPAGRGARGGRADRGDDRRRDRRRAGLVRQERRRPRIRRRRSPRREPRGRGRRSRLLRGARARPAQRRSQRDVHGTRAAPATWSRPRWPRAVATGAPASSLERGSPRAPSQPRSTRPPSRSPRCRCSVSRSSATASTPRSRPDCARCSTETTSADQWLESIRSSSDARGRRAA